MKRLSVICCLAVGLLAGVACQKDNAGQLPPNNYIGADDAGVLLANLVVTDTLNNFQGYMTGFGLNPADPGEITIPCETVEKAREIFSEWLPEGISAVEDGENLIWNMTDTLGVSQGAAILKPGGDKGAVAHLELPSDFPIVTGVFFTPKRSMPENAELDFADVLDQYYFGNIVNVYGSNTAHGGGVFCVIREYDQDTNTSGILLSLPDTEHKIDHISVYEQDIYIDQYFKRARKLSELQGPIGETYRKYRKYIDAKLDKNSLLHQTHGDHWFAMLQNNGKYGRYNLVTKEAEEKYRTTNAFLLVWGPDFYECLAYFFTLEKDKNGVYQVVLK